jgi:exosortase family protein XrtF
MSQVTSIKTVYRQFKTIINFLLVFMLTFFVMSAVYDYYLHRTGERVDGMSSFVATQAADLLGLLGFEASAYDVDTDKSSHVAMDGFARVKVIEGCNGLSVMILFLAFLLGFPGKIKTKVWFIPAGLLVIHLFNVFRVATLGWAVYSFGETGYPIYKELFTASIYLLVMAIWYVWVQRFGFPKAIKA